MTVCTSRGIIVVSYITAVLIYRRNITMLQPTDTIYNTALYCRLSKDDGYSDRDSSSIENQRDILTRYCNDHGMIVYDCYAPTQQ